VGWFQFHSGSIQTVLYFFLQLAGLCFNSTLVRFKRNAARLSWCARRVSIPLWFDSNNYAAFHSTLHTRVSIPLWFDSNRDDKKVKKFFLTVSIPLWFDSNLFVGSTSFWNMKFQFHSGSIQTTPPTFVGGSKNRFQFHSGSIQTRLPKSRISQIESFNSTLVRFKPDKISTQQWVEYVSIPLWFDSNLANWAILRYVIRVSIPLWFDSNWWFDNVIFWAYICFNSTLVRFKPECLGNLSASSRRFNSTLVRFKPACKVLNDEVVVSFNSTLVRFKRFSKR